MKGSENAAAAAAAFVARLSLTERLAVGTLILGGVFLVGTYQDTIQRAVVLAVAMVCALLNGAFNALVCVTIHIPSSFFWIQT